MIIKNGEYIAIDSVETDDTLSGTGRPGEPLGLANPWKSTIEAWTKIEPEKVDAWTKIPLPPSDEESKDKMYGWKNGAWAVINASSEISIVETEDGTVQAVATEEKKSLKITGGDGIILEAKTATDGGPSLNIAIDTTDVIDIATTIPADDTSKDSAIPNVGAVKAYVDGHKGSSPSYDPTDGSINLTV